MPHKSYDCSKEDHHRAFLLHRPMKRRRGIRFRAGLSAFLCPSFLHSKQMISLLSTLIEA
ncbi:hypothetical protein JHK82_050573 [Glycine max]|nr:hypothetical protein JHK82_050573 [Glycine max]